jgi:formylglycine-generating enzyme required for sulfatase activity
MSDIFISYARQDRPRAETLARALEEHGWSVWWDWNIPAGKTFRQVIQAALDEARCVVVLWSARSITRKWVLEEASEGEQRGILVPVRIENVRPPLGFRSIQAADLIDWEGKPGAPAFRRLCADIEALIGAPADSASPKGYVWIPPGDFWIGAMPGDSEARPDEKPRHRVRITKGFWMGETPVTVAAYEEFTRKSGVSMPPAPSFNPGWSKKDHPIVNVTWDDAKAYCTWAGGRLPTEAEWEYAARGGQDGLKYPWGNDLTPENANYLGSKWQGTSPVRSYPPNGWGLYDMAGNVWEWVADWYGEDYYKSLPPDRPAENPSGPGGETGVRVLRGGAFSNNARYLRASNRYWIEPDLRVDLIGFRCVREVVP